MFPTQVTHLQNQRSTQFCHKNNDKFVTISEVEQMKKLNKGYDGYETNQYRYHFRLKDLTRRFKGQ